MGSLRTLVFMFQNNSPSSLLSLSLSLSRDGISVGRRGSPPSVFFSLSSSLPSLSLSLSLSLSFSLLVFPLSPSLSRDGNFSVTSSLSSSSLSFLSLCRFCRSDLQVDRTNFDRSGLIGILKDRGHQINGQKCSRLKSRYLTILMELKAEILWA